MGVFACRNKIDDVDGFDDDTLVYMRVAN